MKPVRKIVSKAVPLERSNVDTDQIIPAVWLKRVERTGYADGLFEAWRKDPDFVLNQSQYVGGTILIAGSNFGIGSSREHAVWALQDYGFEAVVSSRFGDIFFNNCISCGLVPVVVDSEVVDELFKLTKDNPQAEVTIDVENKLISVVDVSPDSPSFTGANKITKPISAPIHLDDFSIQKLVNGWDNIDLTLQHEKEITAYEQNRPSWMVTVS
ncbi:MAG: 3-isopropylmalate dehydratase small subunit [Actinobacteria bacterium]|nr:3-isopropylmalate dehydratase small subunit [Actinomycetota bacterium]MCL6105129.1 3-isopropylmalate dehydratase small subunit [Actinomycetota bacterium]